MPVLLNEQQTSIKTWLSGSPADAFALARSFDPSAMRIFQSGFEKKDSNRDRHWLLSLVDPEGALPHAALFLFSGPPVFREGSMPENPTLLLVAIAACLWAVAVISATNH